MTLRHADTGRIDDALLVAHLHEELDPAEALAVARHLEVCDVCRSRVAALEEGTRRLGEALRQSDYPLPAEEDWRTTRERLLHAAERRRSVRFRIAAGWMLAIVAAAALASAPGRAWIVDRWTQLTASDDPAPAPQEPVAPGEGAELAFEPDGAALAVLLEGVRSAGVLTVRFDDGARAVITVTDGGTEQLTAGARTLRIGNQDSRTSYTLTLPSGVDTVTVRVADREPIVLTRAGSGSTGADAAIDLTSGRRVRNGPARDEQ